MLTNVAPPEVKDRLNSGVIVVDGKSAIHVHFQKLRSSLSCTDRNGISDTFLYYKYSYSVLEKKQLLEYIEYCCFMLFFVGGFEAL